MKLYVNVPRYRRHEPRGKEAHTVCNIAEERIPHKYEPREENRHYKKMIEW